MRQGMQGWWICPNGDKSTRRARRRGPQTAGVRLGSRSILSKYWPVRGAVCSTALLVLVACQGARLQDSVPLTVRNQHPAQLLSMHAGARPGAALGEGDVEVEGSLIWSNLWLRPGAGQDRIELDGELLRVEPGLRVGLGRGFELAARVPLFSTSGGELDSFLEGWHDAFGLPQNQRNEFDRGRFVVRADRNTGSGLETAWELGREGLHIADIPIELAWFPVGAPRGSEAVDGGPWSFGLRAGVELPTGDEAIGFGNGGFDFMLGFAGAYRRERWALTAWGGHTWTSRPDSARAVGLPWGDLSTLGLAGEVAITDRLSALVQLEWESSVLKALDETHADRNQLLIWMGGRWAFSDRSSIEVSVGEDLIRSVSPDVSFALGIRHRL